MDEKNSTLSAMRRSWKLVFPYRRKVYGGVMLSFFTAGLSIVSSYTLSILVDFVFPEKRMDLLWPIQFLFLGAVLLESVLGLWQTRLFSTAATCAQKDLRRSLFQKTVRMDYLSRQETRMAETIAALSQKVDSLYGALYNAIPVAVSYIVDILLTLSVMAIINWKLMLFSLPVYPLMFWANQVVQRRITERQRQYQSAYTDATNDVSEAMRCHDMIRNYHLENYIEERYAQSVLKLQKSDVHLNVLFDFMQRIGWTMIMVPYQAILYGVGGSWLITDGSITIGTLLIFANFTNHLLKPVMGLIGISSEVGTACAAYDALDNYMMIKEQCQHSCSSSDTSYVASIKALSYAYPSQEQYLLQNLNINICDGDTLVLWGSSGCGKSTLLKLLNGQLSATSEDMISFNAKKSWGYFPQHPTLLNISLWDNFKIVAPKIQEDDVWNLLRKISMENAVKSKPNGLFCQLNDSENLFSGGEFRRLCLAVFLAADTDVMLFDEPTAELDEKSAGIIAKVLSETKTLGKKTMVIATHDKTLQQLASHVLAL